MPSVIAHIKVKADKVDEAKSFFAQLSKDTLAAEELHPQVAHRPSLRASSINEASRASSASGSGRHAQAIRQAPMLAPSRCTT